MPRTERIKKTYRVAVGTDVHISAFADVEAYTKKGDLKKAETLFKKELRMVHCFKHCYETVFFFDDEDINSDAIELQEL